MAADQTLYRLPFILGLIRVNRPELSLLVSIMSVVGVAVSSSEDLSIIITLSLV